MRQRAIIVGAGGHAAVLADAILASGNTVVGFTDSDVSLHGSRICDCPVLGADDALTAYRPDEVLLVNGLGPMGGASNRRRYEVQVKLETLGWEFLGVRHPSAVASSFAMVGSGAQLLAGCVVQVGASIGASAVVNTAAVIEHGVSIGAWAHVAPGAVVCGEAVVGANTLIGAGAVVRQGVIIGADCIVGAGAVVVRDFPDGSRCFGNPAKLAVVRT